MILTANAETVRQTNRRQTPNGWNTAFIGANRYTIKPGEPIPAEDALHPVAFLVEKGPGGITKPHFHRADQYQVVVWDPGAKYMPDNRAELRASRDRHTHWEATTDPMPPVSDAVLKETAAIASAQVLEGEHGLATWRYRVPADGTLTGPKPSNGGGQFWVVLAGTLATGESGFLPVNSTIFVGPGDGALSATAGPGGAEALCLQFRVPYARR